MKTELFILKTKVVSDEVYLFYRYKIYDDNDAITETGIKYRKYEDDMEISDNGVYKDSVGSYTKDDDDNKVYHQLDVYLLDSMFYSRDRDNYSFIIKKGEDDPVLKEIEFSDFDKDGKYTLDNDDITVNIDLSNKMLSWEPKNGDTGVIDIEISLDALFFVNEDMNQQQVLNHQFEVYSVDNIHITQDNIDKDYNTLYAKLSDKTDELKDHVNNFITELSTLNGSEGAYLRDNTKVKLEAFNDIIWTIEKSFHYMNDRGIVKVGYKVYSVEDEGTENEYKRHMVVDQNLVSEVIND